MGSARYDAAEVHAGRALELNPRNDQALVMLAGLSERKGRLGGSPVEARSVQLPSYIEPSVEKSHKATHLVPPLN